jgi:predicted transcriptional regulator
MTDRQLILETVQKMPEQASMAEILDELALVSSVKKGLAEIQEGKGIAHEQVVRQFSSWITELSGPLKQ